MIIYVANPLYDAVFKYLMEDERIAKTILTALLKKKVTDVKIRRNEYANVTRRESISMFRIDFAATVLDEEDKPHLMLIELQKTWLPSETLRFRRYLALQYNNEENMQKEADGKFAIPMVAIYLLGHCIGEVTEPVVYVNHRAYDYDGKEVKDGMPDPFVESLQHDSIIVQIPLLHGRVNNRLEQLLSVFDQANVADDKKVIKVDDKQFEGDDDMEYVVRRLQSAAADPDMRYLMNAEDEFFRELESRDTLIMEKDKALQEKSVELQEKSAELQEKSAELQEKSAELQEKSAELQEKSAELQEKSAELQEKSVELQEKDNMLQEKSAELQEKDNMLQEKDNMLQEKDNMLRTMILGMQKNGMSITEIAKMLGKTDEEIGKLV